MQPPPAKQLNRLTNSFLNSTPSTRLGGTSTSKQTANTTTALNSSGSREFKLEPVVPAPVMTLVEQLVHNGDVDGASKLLAAVANVSVHM